MVAVIVDCALYRDGERVEETRNLVKLAAAAAQRRRLVRLDRPARAHARSTWSGVARVFGLHPLAVEDAVTAHQRPKLDAYDDSLFVVLRTLTYTTRPRTSRPARS